MWRAGLTLGSFFLLLLLLVVQLFWLAPAACLKSNAVLNARKSLVRQLSLTDLALWTEARYSRHPSQADLFSAFQDGPAAFDYFPAGSILAPVTPQLNTRLQVKKRAGRP